MTLTAGKLDIMADASTISFTLTAQHLVAVAGLTEPELTIEPGAVQDTSGNLIVGSFDVSTAAHVRLLSVSSQEIIPRGMAFSNDGAKMFVVGEAGDDINEYTPSIPFNVTTTAHAHSFNVSAQDVSLQGMAFSNDGAKMFVVGDQGNDINEYTLSTPFDVSNVAFAHSLNVSSRDIAPQGVAFSNDGTKMFVVGAAGSAINEYTLFIPFDVSTATFAHSFSVLTQETVPQGMAFSNDGAKMFVVGSVGDAVNEYTLSSVYPLRVTGLPAGVAFATTWKTTSANEPITFPANGTYTINWGDGTSPIQDVENEQHHTYVTAGTYTVRIYGGLEAIDLSGDSSNAAKLRSIEQWGNTEWTTMNSAFRDASNMVYNADDAPDLSGVDDMSHMFLSTPSFNGNLSRWNVSSVTDMSNMFYDASSFNQPLSNWDVSSVTDMSNMFFSASSFNQPLSSWNVSSVTDMSNMFYDASSFNGNLSIWNVSSVDNMLYMFDDASSFNQNLGNWYVVPADTTYATSEGTLNVTTISAQNMRLDGHSPSYGIGSDGNSNLFNITDSKTFMFKSTPSTGTYNVNVTASGTDVFANGNNWRLLEIRVTGQTTDTTPPVITLTGSSTVTITVGDTYSDAGATCTDNVDASPTLTSSGIVDTSQTGTYTVTYSCADTAGNTATPVSRTVNVEAASDTTPPVITLTGSSSTPNLVLIDQWGNTQWTSMESAFYGANNMVYKARSADCAGQCALYADARMCFCADDDRAAGRICNACGLKAEGARDASTSESDSRYAAPSSVGVHAYRGAVP